MGMIEVDIQVSTRNGENERALSAVVDTGSYLSSVPSSLLREIGVTPHETQKFELADGSVIEEAIGYATLAVNGHSVITLVSFGSDETEALLGALTLQEMRLTVDPVNELLAPAPPIRRYRNY